MRGEVGGGRFGDGFLGGGVGSLLGPIIERAPGGAIGRTIAAAVVGGTASKLGGGKFANGAISAAFVNLFNDQAHSNESIGPIEGYDETGENSWRAANDQVFIDAATAYSQEHGLSSGDDLYISPRQLKAWAMVESGGHRAAFLSDPLQVNNPGDWVVAKAVHTDLTNANQPMTPALSARAGLQWLRYKGSIHDSSGNVTGYRSLRESFRRYNGNTQNYSRHPGVEHRDWYADQVIRLGRRQ